MKKIILGLSVVLATVLSGDAIGGAGDGGSFFGPRVISAPVAETNLKVGRRDFSVACNTVEGFFAGSKAKGVDVKIMFHGYDTQDNEYAFVLEMTPARAADQGPAIVFARTAEQGRMICIHSVIEMNNAEVNLPHVLQFFDPKKYDGEYTDEKGHKKGWNKQVKLEGWEGHITPGAPACAALAGGLICQEQ